MSSFATPQRRPHKPSDLVAAPVVAEKVSGPSAPLPDSESPATARPAHTAHALVAQRPLTPIPIFRSDEHSPAAPIPHLKQSPAPAMRPLASLASTESASSDAQEDSAARETSAEAAGHVMQAKVSVKHVGSGSAVAGCRGGGPPLQRKNTTGLPDQLKDGIETLSNITLDDVRVHYNSAKPATMQALAYAQGTDIHIAPGQERHLSHEAWHVVQQGQGRVKPTLHAKGVAINDDRALENEADVMGVKASQYTAMDNTSPEPDAREMSRGLSSPATIQRASMILDLGDADLARSLTAASAHLGLASVPFETADLKGVNSGETVTILGHGNPSAFKYDAQTFADMLAKKGLKSGVNIVLSGCHTGKGFSTDLAFWLTFGHMITPGTVDAPTTLGTLHASGALAAADAKTDTVKMGLYKKLGDQQAMAQFDLLGIFTGEIAETKSQLATVSATQPRLRRPAVIEEEMRNTHDAGRIIDLGIELEEARKVWNTGKGK